jgi:hypothetical protein
MAKPSELDLPLEGAVRTVRERLDESDVILKEAPKTPDKVPAVIEQSQKLDESLSKLQDALRALVDHVQPILTPAQEGEHIQPDPPPSGVSKMAQNVAQWTSNVNEAVVILRDIDARLEL